LREKFDRERSRSALRAILPHMPDTPAHRYYTSLEGRWSGHFVQTITSWRALRGRPLATKAMAISGWLIGATRMSTTLEASGAGFHHTTRIEKLGVTVLESDEDITLLPDGRSLRMTGVLRPRFGRPVPYEAEGEIDESAAGAVYRITWPGMQLTQKTRVMPEGLELTQETAWARARVVLRRTGRMAAIP